MRSKNILAILLTMFGLSASAQTSCFFNPNTGAWYHNSSLSIYDITTGDFNSDGHLDVVTANSVGSNISFIPGYGNGTLGAPDTVTVPGTLFCITSGDFNGDGNLDIATSNGVNVFTLLGNGNGTFQPYTTYSPGSGSRIYAKDINNDTILDLIGTGSFGVFVLIGQPGGLFLTAAQYPTGGSTADLTIADFDGDGTLDIVTTTAISWTISVLSFLKGNSNGIFSSSISTPVPHHSIFGINSEDVDNDGNMDLIVSNSNVSINRIEIYFGNGNGTFNSPIFYPTFYNPNYVYLTDIDNDSIKDIVVVDNGGFSILRGQSNGVFNTFQYFQAVSTPNALTIGDYNEDGKIDFVVPSGSAGLIAVMLNCSTTGIAETNLNLNYSLAIFPNPFSTETTLYSDKIFNDATLTVYNSYGQQIKQIKNISGQTFTLQRDNIPIGLYFISITQDHKIIAANKLVID